MCCLWQLQEQCQSYKTRTEQQGDALKQLQGEKENLTKEKQQFEKNATELNKELDNTKQELGRLKQEMENWKDKHAQLTTETAKVTRKYLCHRCTSYLGFVGSLIYYDHLRQKKYQHPPGGLF